MRRHLDKRILFVGEQRGNGLSRYRACQSICADAAFVALPRLPGFAGRVLGAIEYRSSSGPLSWLLNRRILSEARRFRPDIVWIEIAHEVLPSTIRAIKQDTGATVLNLFSDDVFSLDYPSQRYTGHFRRALPHYDILFTPRSASREEFLAHGARQVEMFWKGYDEHSIHRQTTEPVCDVVFVGNLDESQRFEYLCALGEAGLRLHVHGGAVWKGRKWPAGMGDVYRGHPRFGAPYAAAVASGRVAINFLSHVARDSQNSRAFEIPATGTMMLTERSGDLEGSFREGVEADFFTSKDELVEKALHYVHDDAHRRAVAQAGYERAVPAYGNSFRVRDMLRIVAETPQA